VAEALPSGQTKFKAAAICLNITDKGLGEVFRGINSGHPFFYGQVLQRIHDICDMDILGAPDRTGITRNAIKGCITFKYIFFHPCSNHGEDFTWREIHVLRHRATPPTGTTLDASFQAGSPRSSILNFPMERRDLKGIRDYVQWGPPYYSNVMVGFIYDNYID
jgi:hypothetical protein